MIRRRIDTFLKVFERPFETYNRLEISQSALLHNVQLFAEISGKAVIPVLKANAYGHGIEQVATAYKSSNVPYLAVDGYFEALRIRAVSKRPVLVMGMIKPENYAKLRYLNFAFVVHSKDAIRALGNTGKRIKVHLEVNTGMNRCGVEPHEVAAYIAMIRTYPKLELEGMMSHLADSDGTQKGTVKKQVQRFDVAVETAQSLGVNPRWRHVAQSAGSLRAQSKYANAVRVGIGGYGVNPFPHDHPNRKDLLNLQPAMRLISTITEVHTLKRGDQVSYNYTFTAPKAMRIGVLPLGYYEGVPREISNTGVVKVGSHYEPIVGRVCMNHTMISLAETLAQVGDEVTVFSDHPDDKNAINRVADEHNLFSYRMLTGLSIDVRRKLVL